MKKFSIEKYIYIYFSILLLYIFFIPKVNTFSTFSLEISTFYLTYTEPIKYGR